MSDQISAMVKSLTKDKGVREMETNIAHPKSHRTLANQLGSIISPQAK